MNKMASTSVNWTLSGRCLLGSYKTAVHCRTRTQYQGLSVVSKRGQDMHRHDYCGTATDGEAIEHVETLFAHCVKLNEGL